MDTNWNGTAVRNRATEFLALVVLLGVCIEASEAQPARRPATSNVEPRPGFDFYFDRLPDGAVARLGTKRYRAERGTSAFFLADGETVLVITDRWPSPSMEYYEARTGRRFHSVSLDLKNVMHAKLSRDRKWLAIHGIAATAGPPLFQILVVNAATSETTASLATGDRPLADGLAISSDGGLIATARDRSVSVYDAKSGEQTARLEIDVRNGVDGVEFSPDGRVLAVLGIYSLHLWNWKIDAEPREVTIQGTRSNHVLRSSASFSPHGEILAVGMDGDVEVQLVDVKSGAVIGDLTSRVETLHYCSNTEFSPDGRFLAATRRGDRDRGIGLWDVQTKKLVRGSDILGRGIEQLSYSPNGDMLAGVDEHVLTVFDLATGENLADERPGHDSPPQHLAFLDDGDRLVSAGDDGSVRFWDVASGEQLRRITISQQPERWSEQWIRGFAVSPNEKHFATSSLLPAVGLWDMDTGNEIYRLAGHGRTGGKREIAFSSDSQRFASWGDDMYVYVWDVATGRALNEYRVQPGGAKLPADGEDQDDVFGDFGMMIGRSRFSPDASRLLINFRNHIHVFDVETSRELYKIDMPDQYPMGVAISPDNQYMLHARLPKRIEIRQADGTVEHERPIAFPVILRDMRSGEVVHEHFIPNESPGPVAFSWDSKYFAVGAGGVDPSIFVFDTESREQRIHITNLGSSPASLAFSKDGRRLASSLNDTTVLVWDLRSLNDERE